MGRLYPTTAPVLLTKGTERQPDRVPGGAPAPETHSLDERWLCCALCGARVCREEDRIEIDGAHAHTKFNPAGILFQIGCFAEAPGCVEVTPPSAEFPWFEGYRWRICVCRACQSHLGWSFAGPAQFFGLILDKLRPESDA